MNYRIEAEESTEDKVILRKEWSLHPFWQVVCFCLVRSRWYGVLFNCGQRQRHM